MRKTSIFEKIILYCSLSILLIGCTNFAFGTNTTQNNNTGKNAIKIPSEKQDESLIITGKYIGKYNDNSPCTVLINKTNNKKFPFSVNINAWDLKCYQDKNNLICLLPYAEDEDQQTDYLLLRQSSNTEMVIEDHNFVYHFGGSSTGDPDFCEGVIKKSKQ